ncbi:hypothetical protein [Natronomonas sp.]|uniref:hypothetical protein n=1 Tax=Natronomonas sp. TaxID=2184060 RepID=UPI002637C982|nr:hypothetical protein [Natronomonas sp.]
MGVSTERDEATREGENEPPVGLRAHATSPERTVFTEPGNNDGWISTDLTVDVQR